MNLKFKLEISKDLDPSFLASIDHNFDIASRCSKILNVDLYDNQIEILEDFLDINIQYLLLLEARGAGKTFGISCGAVLACLDTPGFNIGVFAPKEGQATRLLNEIYKILKHSNVKDKIDLRKSSSTKLPFNNGSMIMAFSGSPHAEVEGPHFNCVILDESHKIPDISISQKIIPMLGSHESVKIVKMGVPLYKNHFHRSYRDSKYTILEKDWLNCPILLKPGSFVYEGKEYPKYVVDVMPIKLKKQFFPNNKDLWYEGEMDEDDFRTQYMLQWIDSKKLFLNGEDQEKLYGEHHILDKAIMGEEYYFGLDTAPGNLEGEYDEDDDYTSLSIWRIIDGIKMKIAAFQWQGDPGEQMEDIETILHPEEGIFKCKFGLVDYTNIGISLVTELQNIGVNVDGIVFNHNEKISKKNYKNAMSYNFRHELRSGRVKYPSQGAVDADDLISKHFDEWCLLEEIKKLGINNVIQAPTEKKEGEKIHDDGPMSDILAIWACDKLGEFKQAQQQAYKIPKIVTGVASVMKRHSNQQQSGFLGGK